MYDVIPLELLDKKSVPGVLRFGKFSSLAS
ncbi:hypothetical protein OESDEN_22886 [Oesophagostomum dentatum]|uniref:Uncharacterized protein n=1 Tax=Oesophagostomum dentatum TaxID=61180 RepID=A0A0B1RXT7_OESDE|nr:hypothetical protein OESDEN_22886 [Oesophagostomum dentatum]